VVVVSYSRKHNNSTLTSEETQKQQNEPEGGQKADGWLSQRLSEDLEETPRTKQKRVNRQTKNNKTRESVNRQAKNTKREKHWKTQEHSTETGETTGGERLQHYVLTRGVGEDPLCVSGSEGVM
jgi:hypothetical protein